MFDYNKMIQRAVKFFPTWSDIRKRYKTSTGGRYVSSFLEEITELEEAIKEYKKYYFLDTYEGHEDDIMAYAYRFPIGEIETESLHITYNNKSINITEEINQFLSYELIAYYESGIVYLNDKIDPELVSISVYGSELESEYTLSSVWNIFDEFACFVDVQRHPGEKNSELVKRILYRTANKPNASIEGLQNAIMTELVVDFPEITRDDIKIEQVDDVNIRQAYKGFSSLLDYLNSINCDVYRWKRWDLNTWQHDFKSISYIPTLWDEAISNFTNGVGYGNDCEVSIASNVQKTDAIITLYNKSKETMNKYLADKNLERNISFSFKKYNDILSSNLINYTIKASKLTRLYPNEIKMSVYQNIQNVLDIPIEDIFSHGHNITTDRTDTQLTDVYPYRFKFEAKDNNEDIYITKCMVHYVDNKTGLTKDSVNLLKNKTGFKINAFGSLVSNSIKRSITKVEDFDNKQYMYLKNVENSSGIQVTGTSGYGIKTLYNLGGQEISYKTSCEPSAITKDMNLIELNSTYGVWDNNNINFYPDSRAKRITIRITANQFSFDVLSNNTVNVMVRYAKEGNYEIIEKASMGTTWSTDVFDTPRYMEIVIGTSATETVRVGNFKYSNYGVRFSYKIGNQPYKELKGNILPNNNNIILRVEVVSSSGSNPVLHGIFIGTNLSNSVYITDSALARNDCKREIEIVSNAKVTLIKRDIFDSTDILYTENYDPVVSYVAQGNDAYVRLDLSEYGVINSINTSVGQVQKIEESGVIYYNVALAKGQSLKRLTIDGAKSEAVYEATLLDMINKELETPFDLENDRLYCSLLIKGVIVIKNSEDGKPILLSLKSSLFYGTDGTKYEFYDMPGNVGAIWGSGDSKFGDGISGSFDYISFYEEGSVVHTANNTYDLFINEVKDVPVAINFTQPELYDPKGLYFYTVECNSDNVDVKFYNENQKDTHFDNLNYWTIGMSNLYIKSADDYNNESIYNINVLDYSDKYTLSEYINIKDSYDISVNNTVLTEQYIVVPPKGMEVRYLSYDATSETEHLLKQESIVVDDRMFKKLQFSNIDRVMNISSEDVTNIKYNLLHKEGIIVWTEKPKDGTIINIEYTIKKPVALVFDLDTLYELTGYTVDTYQRLNTYYLSDMNNGETYDLRNFSEYEKSDLAYIQCEEPSFEGQMLDRYTVKFNKHVQEKTVLVKTGYYYINGMEYYLFSEEGDKKLKNNKHITYENVDTYDEYLYTYKRTNNYVRNSEMVSRNINELYEYNCDIPIKSPKYNKYTACDSYNNWNEFNSVLKLTDELYLRRLAGEAQFEGFNNVALFIQPENPEVTNYAYIDITEYVTEKTYLTLAATHELNIYIGKEVKFGSLDFNTALSIESIVKVLPISGTSIRTCSFNTSKDTRYYLIVEGTGIIDDIVMSDVLDSTVNYHVKNIEKIGFYFNETKTDGTTYKMSIDNNTKTLNKGASLCSDGRIRIVGDVTWGTTKIKTYETFDDFTNPRCYKDVELIVSDYLKSPNTTSCRFITDFIEINPDIINRLFVRVNDVLIDNMDQFKITIHTTSNKKNPTKNIITHRNSYAFTYGHNLEKYIKVEIEIPEDYVINKFDIVAEYKTTDKKAPMLNLPITGTVTSQVYDVQESLNYNIKNININDISNINDVEIYIRAMTDNNTSGIWSDWNKLELKEKSGKAIFDQARTKTLDFRYRPVRFFQFKLVLKSKEAYIDFDSIDIEVVE